MSVVQAYDFLIQWHLTERCNLKCAHCYQDSEKPEELSFSEVAATIKAAAQTVKDWEEIYEIEFSPSFNVTGGEPFLRVDFFYILEQMLSTGFEIYILSNGTLITRERASRIRRLGVHGVQVSIEGGQQTHDLIRGPGSFAAAVAGIRNLLEAGVKVSMNATLSQVNAPEFLDLVDLATTLGVPRLGFSRLVPSGRGLAMLPQMLSTQQVKDIYEEIFTLQVEGLEITSGDPVATQMRLPPPPEDEGDIAMGGCAAGISGLTLLPDGAVTPCRRLPLPLGNVRQQSLREIWATSPLLEALRNRSQYQGRCGLCKRWAQCRGCRAIAYAFSQYQARTNFLAPDPQCFIENDSESPD